MRLEPQRNQRPPTAERALTRAVLPAVFDRRGLGAQAQGFVAARAFWLALPRLRGLVRAVGFSEGCLYLRAEHEFTARALQRAPHDILVKLPRLPDGAFVRRLQCRVGSLEGLPEWHEAPPPPPPPRQPCYVDEDVAAALLDVHDDGLRDLLASLYVTACDAGRPIGAPRSTP